MLPLALDNLSPLPPQDSPTSSVAPQPRRSRTTCDRPVRRPRATRRRPTRARPRARPTDKTRTTPATSPPLRRIFSPKPTRRPTRADPRRKDRTPAAARETKPRREMGKRLPRTRKGDGKDDAAPTVELSAAAAAAQASALPAPTANAKPEFVPAAQIAAPGLSGNAALGLARNMQSAPGQAGSGTPIPVPQEKASLLQTQLVVGAGVAAKTAAVDVPADSVATTQTHSTNNATQVPGQSEQTTAILQSTASITSLPSAPSSASSPAVTTAVAAVAAAIVPAGASAPEESETPHQLPGRADAALAIDNVSAAASPAPQNLPPAAAIASNAVVAVQTAATAVAEGDSTSTKTGPAERTIATDGVGAAKPAGTDGPNPTGAAAHGSTSQPAQASTSLGSPKSGAIVQADRVRFVQRVEQAFQSMSAGGGTVRLKLSPPELGSMRWKSRSATGR